MVTKQIFLLLVVTLLLSIPIQGFAIDDDGDGEPRSIKIPVSYSVVGK